jgi:hypothetical protein
MPSRTSPPPATVLGRLNRLVHQIEADREVRSGSTASSPAFRHTGQRAILRKVGRTQTRTVARWRMMTSSATRHGPITPFGGLLV